MQERLVAAGLLKGGRTVAIDATTLEANAAEQVEAAHAASSTPAELTEIVADKGYHSNQTMLALEAGAVRSYIAEPERGRRDWTKTPEAQSPVYGHRRRGRGARGKRLMRRRGEYVERTFAHVYDTGALRHGTPRGLQGRRFGVGALEIAVGMFVERVWMAATPLWPISRPMPVRTAHLFNGRACVVKSATSTTGC